MSGPRGIGLLAALAGAALAVPMSITSMGPAQHETAAPVRASAKQTKAVKRQQRTSGETALRGYRNKGPQAKPRKRPNRNTISKRVRRKHRRAA